MKNEVCDKLIHRENRVEDGSSYTYELTYREASEVAAFRLPLYSVKVTMTTSDGRCREATARDIFSNRAKARDFFDMLVRNLATPIDLGYVVEDELG